MTSGAVLFTEAAFSIYPLLKNKRHNVPGTLHENPYSTLQMICKKNRDAPKGTPL